MTTGPTADESRRAMIALEKWRSDLEAYPNSRQSERRELRRRLGENAFSADQALALIGMPVQTAHALTGEPVSGIHQVAFGYGNNVARSTLDELVNHLDRAIGVLRAREADARAAALLAPVQAEQAAPVQTWGDVLHGTNASTGPPPRLPTADAESWLSRTDHLTSIASALAGLIVAIVAAVSWAAGWI